MVDLAVAAQLSEWSFDKPALATRPQRSSSDSSASSPNLCDDVPDTLRLDTATIHDANPASRKESMVLQDRYLSSEEDLTADDASGSDSDYDMEDVVIHDPAKECKAKTMSISRWEKGRSCDMAVLVSYAFAGRPKVVEMDCRSPIIERPNQQRAASLANLPVAAIHKLREENENQRRSMNILATTRVPSSPSNRSILPVADVEPRRPSTSHSPITQKPAVLYHTESASTSSSFQTAPSSRSVSPASSEAPPRPSTSFNEQTASARSSVYIPSRSRLDLTKIQTTKPSYRHSQFAPPTPQSPALSFLSSDPYEHATTNSSSPIIKKPATHKRLRSISMKLALAKIAISPSKYKSYDARIDGKAPLTPSTPYTPMTPQTAPIEGSASVAGPNRLRRASTILRPKSRHGDSIRAPTPETAPPVPSVSTVHQRRMTMGKMVARGADEREPTLVLPPCPDNIDHDPMSSLKSRKLRKRKSLMDFMDSLA